MSVHFLPRPPWSFGGWAGCWDWAGTRVCWGYGPLWGLPLPWAGGRSGGMYPRAARGPRGSSTLRFPHAESTSRNRCVALPIGAPGTCGGTRPCSPCAEGQKRRFAFSPPIRQRRAASWVRADSWRCAMPPGLACRTHDLVPDHPGLALSRLHRPPRLQSAAGS
ncbi:hypothetical protein ACU18_03930 [Arthrobacter sp. ZBG10]|nr:hypothetical protein ACU18_03930 [Arthrobacter sp. ZBG10]